MSSPAMQSKGGQGREGTPGKQADDCPVPKAAGCLPVQRAPRMTQKKQSLLSLTGTRMCMMGSSYFFPLVLDCHCAEDLRGDVGILRFPGPTRRVWFRPPSGQGLGICIYNRGCPLMEDQPW